MPKVDSKVWRIAVWGVVIASIVLVGACSGSDSAGPGGDRGGASLVDSIVLTLDSTNVTIGDTVRLRAVPRDSSGAPVTGIALVWASSDTTIATVSSDGLITTKDMGDVDIDVSDAAASTSRTMHSEIRARAGRGSRSSRIQIHSVPRIVITPAATSIDVGGKVQYSASITDASGNSLRRTPSVRWTSSSPGVATIDIAGLATAIKKGTTLIRAIVSTSTSYDYTSSGARLDVGVCGGLLDVVTWDATSLSSSYSQTRHVPGSDYALDFTVAQSSSGTARLVRVPGSADGDSVRVWEGQVSGTTHVNNKQIQTPNSTGFVVTTTEKGDGPQGPASLVRISAEVTENSGCRVSVRYDDDVHYNHVETSPDPLFEPLNFDVISAVSISVNAFVSPGSRPATGWKLEATIQPNAIEPPDGPIDDGDLSGLGPSQYYRPVISIPATMLQLAPNFTLGKANFSYSLKAH